MDAPEGFVRLQEAAGFGVVRRDLGSLPLSTWWQEGEPLPQAQGRGGVTILEVMRGVVAAVRTYRRGGVLRLLGGRFLDGDRALRELEVLARLRREAVPVVEPLAAVSRRRGRIHQMRLATVLIPDALPLPAFVAGEPRHRRAAAHRAGSVVGQALSVGLWHPDLHPDNLIARPAGDKVEVRLLDLDQAVIRRRLPRQRKDRMLVRMARYLVRHRERIPSSRSDQLRFLRGMGLDRDGRREAVERLAPMLARQVARHRLLWRRRS